MIISCGPNVVLPYIVYISVHQAQDFCVTWLSSWARINCCYTTKTSANLTHGSCERIKGKNYDADIQTGGAGSLKKPCLAIAIAIKSSGSTAQRTAAPLQHPRPQWWRPHSVMTSEAKSDLDVFSAPSEEDGCIIDGYPDWATPGPKKYAYLPSSMPTVVSVCYKWIGHINDNAPGLVSKGWASSVVSTTLEAAISFRKVGCHGEDPLVSGSLPLLKWRESLMMICKGAVTFHCL